MSKSPQSSFALLTEPEKKSKLWQLSQAKGECTLWQRGQKERQTFRVKEFVRESNQLILHHESSKIGLGENLLGSFEMKGMSFFLRGHVSNADTEQFVVTVDGDFYKSERRQNYRLLAYPIYDISASFKLPAEYVGGKVVDIRNKSSQTGLFKSFLKLVEPNKTAEEQNALQIRVQDLSATGMSVYIGKAELEWFRAGEMMTEVDIGVQGEKLTIPQCKIVYVVDSIGDQQKKYKVGIRFESLSVQLEQQISGRINSLLRSVDANKEFEDFIK